MGNSLGVGKVKRDRSIVVLLHRKVKRDRSIVVLLHSDTLEFPWSRKGQKGQVNSGPSA
jgi:hypothetical protein